MNARRETAGRREAQLVTAWQWVPGAGSLTIIILALVSGACGGGGGVGFPSANIGNIPPISSNRAPQIEPIDDQTMRTDGEMTIDVVASDAEGDRLKITLPQSQNPPDFVSLKQTSKFRAVITATPGANDEGFYPIQVVANDGGDGILNFDWESFWLIVRAERNPVRDYYRLPILVQEVPAAQHFGLGWSHSCMIESPPEGASSVASYCWGDNTSGQLGFESRPDNCGPDDSGCMDSPGRVDLAVDLVSIDGGPQHSCGLTAAGETWCWGHGLGGHTPILLVTDLRFVELKASTGDATTCARTEAGELYCWSPDDPTPRTTASEHRFQSFDLGGDFACGIDLDFQTWCWGNNWHGQLGNGTVGQQDGPPFSEEPVPVISDRRFKFLALGLEHACAMTGGGDVYCWGHLVSRTGDELLTGRPESINSSDSYRQIASGALFTCGIERGVDGTTFCWGNIDAGLVLPQGRNIFALHPIHLDPAIRPRLIAAGGDQACGSADGNVYCWGDNDKGQLGRLPAGAP